MALVEAEKLSVDTRAREIETQLIKAEVSVQTIIKAAEEAGAALIVMGSHGRKDGLKLTLGRVAEKVLNLAK